MRRSPRLWKTQSMPLGVISPPIHVERLLTAWQSAPLSLLALALELASAGMYLAGVRRLRQRGRSWSPWRTASFLVGILVVVVAVQSGVASYDSSNFLMHVVQHLLLMNAAPLFLVLSAPVTLALQAGSRRVQTRILRVLHHPVVSVLTHPVVVAGGFYLTMVVYFLSPIYALSLRHPLLHDYTHLHFLVSGCLYWWLLAGLDPSRWRLSRLQKLGILAAGIPVTTIIGLSLTGASASIDPAAHTLADTHAGGALFWVVGELVMLTALGVQLVQWMHDEERAAVRADRRLDAALAAEQAELRSEQPGHSADQAPPAGLQPGTEVAQPGAGIAHARTRVDPVALPSGPSSPVREPQAPAPRATTPAAGPAPTPAAGPAPTPQLAPASE